MMTWKSTMAPGHLGSFLHTSSDPSMIPDPHLVQERVIFSLETPLSLSMDTRKPLENQLGPDAHYKAKAAYWIQTCTTHPRSGRSKEIIYSVGLWDSSGNARSQYLLLEMQTEKLKTSTTMQDRGRWLSLGNAHQEHSNSWRLLDPENFIAED